MKKMRTLPLHRRSGRRIRPAALACAALLLGACATDRGPDPWRSTNEKVFRFNEGFDKSLLEPVAKGYDAVMPSLFQTMIGTFFENLTVPRTFVNDVLQGKPLAAAQDLGRLTVNVVAGMIGFVDVASEIGIPKNDEDFGQTFGRWGAGPGPYLVVPFAGPNNVRDVLATPLDIAANPSTFVNATGATVVRVVNTRAQYLEEFEQARKDAIDFYVFQRDAFLTSREREVRDGKPAEIDDDLYELDDEDLYELDEVEESPTEQPAEQTSTEPAPAEEETSDETP
jgi:phospholipid-binding lipoprotein MlaA